MSGGERSLLTVLSHLPEDVSAVVACPEGELAYAVRALGVGVVEVPGTAGSLKLHPLHTPRALLELAREGLAVRRLAREGGFDLVHANSIRAGLACAPTRARTGPPLVVHVRDCLPDGPAPALVQRLIGARADLVLANSEHTRRSFARAAPSAATGVLHSPVDVERFRPAAIDKSEARERLGLDPAAPVLAVVAQITPWKGQDDAIRVLARLKERHPGARLLLVGSPKFVDDATRHDNRAYVAELERLIDSLAVGGEVQFLGERADVPEILRAVDVVLVPSWEEPFGRAIVEAMAMEVPVVATTSGGPPEIVREGVDGLLLPPRTPERWAAAVERLVEQPEERAAMGRSAGERARGTFGAQRQVEKLLAAYASLGVGRRSSAA